MPEKENIIGKMIVDEDFLTLNEVLMSSEWEKRVNKYSDGPFTMKSIRACLFYLKGMFYEAIECLNQPTTLFENLFTEFLCCHVSKINLTLSKWQIKQIEDSNNPTLIFFLAKIFYLKRNESEFIRLMSLINTHDFARKELLLYRQTKTLLDQFKDCAEQKSSFSKHGNTFFLDMKPTMSAKEDNQFDLLNSNACYFRDYERKASLLKDLKNEESPLDTTLTQDPFCFNTFFLKAEFLLSTNYTKSYELYKAALCFASNCTEAFLANIRLFYIETLLEANVLLGI